MGSPTTMPPTTMSPTTMPPTTMPPTVGDDWVLLFRQTAGFYQPVNQWLSYNEDNPFAPNYSTLNRFENYRGDDGKFELKLVWPERSGDNSQWWKQTSNPVTRGGTHSGVEGYEAVEIYFTDNNWAGLEHGGSNSLLDGSDFTNTFGGYWFYAVGASREWDDCGIPGPSAC